MILSFLNKKHVVSCNFLLTRDDMFINILEEYNKNIIVQREGEKHGI